LRGEWVEGYVIEDMNGLMLRQKTKYYNHWKFFRGIAQHLGAGQTVDTRMFFEAEDNYVFSFLKSLDRETLKKTSVIELRKMYELSR
jgi:hypothetical protein